MSTGQLCRSGLGLFFVLMLAACSTPPRMTEGATAELLVRAPDTSHKAPVRMDESAMLPLLGYFQLLQRMTPQELARERTMLTAIPKTPPAQLRMAMLLGLARTPADLVRARSLLENLLKSTEPAAVSLYPLARLLASQYNERQKIHMQNEKLLAQSDLLGQQLKESLRLSAELQEKLDALATIERTLPVRLPPADALPGAAR